MTVKEFLRHNPRITCHPFPNYQMDLPAWISPRQCLLNQKAGRIEACATCKTGQRMKAEYPGWWAALKVKKVNEFNPGPHEHPQYQAAQRRRIAASVGASRERRAGK